MQKTVACTASWCRTVTGRKKIAPARIGTHDCQPHFTRSLLVGQLDEDPEGQFHGKRVGALQFGKTCSVQVFLIWVCLVIRDVLTKHEGLEHD
jgi:hypothetical protein